MKCSTLHYHYRFCHLNDTEKMCWFLVSLQMNCHMCIESADSIFCVYVCGVCAFFTDCSLCLMFRFDCVCVCVLFELLCEISTEHNFASHRIVLVVNMKTNPCWIHNQIWQNANANGFDSCTVNKQRTRRRQACLFTKHANSLHSWKNEHFIESRHHYRHTCVLSHFSLSLHFYHLDCVLCSPYSQFSIYALKIVQHTNRSHYNNNECAISLRTFYSVCITFNRYVFFLSWKFIWNA